MKHTNQQKHRGVVGKFVKIKKPQYRLPFSVFRFRPTSDFGSCLVFFYCSTEGLWSSCLPWFCAQTKIEVGITQQSLEGRP